MIITNDAHKNLKLVSHPLIADMLTHMRDMKTKNETFARIMDRVAPLLATGGSASSAISLLKSEANAKEMVFINLVAAPEGVSKMLVDHPDVMIYSAALDDGLTDDAYITPGLGDAGDRYAGILPR